MRGWLLTFFSTWWLGIEGIYGLLLLAILTSPIWGFGYAALSEEIQRLRDSWT